MKRALSVLFVAALTLACGRSAFGQYCDIVPSKTHAIVRFAANDVWSWAQTFADGPAWPYWAPSVTVTVALNGAQLHTGQNSPGYGAVADVQFHDAVTTTSGLGAYATSNTHLLTPHPQICWLEQPTSSTSSNTAYVARPSIDTLGLQGVWWLGGGADGANMLFNQMELHLVDSSSPAPPETPYWSISQDDNYAHLECTACQNTVLTADMPTGGCALRVHVTVSRGSLQSEAVDLGVNAPFRMEYQGSTYDNWPYANGWETHIHYKTYDQCDNMFQSIALNEMFPGGWTNTVVNNWVKPTAGGLATYSGNNGMWFDRAKMTAAACTYIPCDPMPQMYEGALTGPEVDRALQVWRAGNATPGSGVGIGSNVALRYLNFGEHQW